MQDSDYSLQLPKTFEKTTELLPFSKHGLSTSQDFVEEKKRLNYLENLKRAGLTDEEIRLHIDDDFKKRHNIESRVLKSKLEDIDRKINKFNEIDCSKPSTSTDQSKYPTNHPIHKLHQLDKILTGHVVNDTSVTKRLKSLRNLKRKKEKILLESKTPKIELTPVQKEPEPGSLWDVKELPLKNKIEEKIKKEIKKPCLGPKKLTMYTIKDNKIMRLEPVPRDDSESEEEYDAVDIVAPMNAAEEQLLEGMKMSIEDIRKIDRFKDYTPGKPTKTLYLKNIAPSVSQQQLSVLFNQFVLDNGGPIDVRLMTGRMRGQAFVTFQNEALAIRALDEITGTILCGRPIVAEFSKNTSVPEVAN